MQNIDNDYFIGNEKNHKHQGYNNWKSSGLTRHFCKSISHLMLFGYCSDTEARFRDIADTRV